MAKIFRRCKCPKMLEGKRVCGHNYYSKFQHEGEPVIKVLDPHPDVANKMMVALQDQCKAKSGETAVGKMPFAVFQQEVLAEYKTAAESTRVIMEQALTELQRFKPIQTIGEITPALLKKWKEHMVDSGQVRVDRQGYIMRLPAACSTECKGDVHADACNRNLRPGACQRYLRAIKTAMRKMEEHDDPKVVERQHWDAVKPFKEKRIIRSVAPEALMQIDQGLNSRLDLPHYITAYYLTTLAGLRREEAAWLWLENVSLWLGNCTDHACLAQRGGVSHQHYFGKITIKHKEPEPGSHDGWHPKNGKERDVAVPGQLGDYLAQLIPTLKSKWIVQNLKGGRIKADTLSLGFRRFLRKIGIKRGSVHIFRHSHATELLNRGANIYEVRDRLGQRSVTTTEIYGGEKRDASPVVMNFSIPKVLTAPVIETIAIRP
jgi:hypothetical protein